MNPLQQFYLNKSQKDAVYAFMVEVLEQRVIESVFSGKTVDGVYEARQTIDAMFSKLEELYATKVEHKPESPR